MYFLTALLLLLIPVGIAQCSRQETFIRTAYEIPDQSIITSVKADTPIRCADRCLSKEGCKGFEMALGIKPCKLLSCVNPNIMYNRTTPARTKAYAVRSPVIVNNLAVQKSASLSPTTSGVFQPASNLVDEIHLDDNSRAETFSIKPWWRVDLGTIHCVTAVNILNRAYHSGIWPYQTFYRVTVAIDEADIFDKVNNECGYPDALDQYYTLVTCVSPLPGRYVQLMRDCDFGACTLSLYEVEVHGY